MIQGAWTRCDDVTITDSYGYLVQRIKHPEMYTVAMEIEIEREQVRRRKLEEQALQRLWQQAVSEVRVRHADPRVDVTVFVNAYHGKAYIDFHLLNLRNTANPDLTFKGVFHHSTVVVGWPGYEAAKKCISGSWALMAIHEAQELVTHRGLYRSYSTPSFMGECEEPVVDSHDSRGLNQRAMASYDVASYIDWVLGVGEGRRLVERNAEQAKRELQNEMDFLDGKIPDWQ